MDFIMNKVQHKFRLTTEGKLPKSSDMECGKFGIYAFLYYGKVIRFGESASGFGCIRKGFNHQLGIAKLSLEAANIVVLIYTNVTAFLLNSSAMQSGFTTDSI
jgi:hypothetical protein